MKSLSSLLPNTEKVLIKLSKDKLFEKFTFVGGSALAVHLNHRKSEYLDFFTWEKELDRELIIKTLDISFGSGYNLIGLSKSQIDCICDGVKVTFFASGWEFLRERENLVGLVNIASVNLPAGMKINTLFLRAKYRDYYDLYCITKDGMDLDELFTVAKIIMPAINLRLFQTALIFTDDIEDDNIKHLIPKYKLTKKQIGQYFSRLLSQWINSNKSII